MRDTLTRFLSAFTLHLLITAPAAGWALSSQFDHLLIERAHADLTFGDFVFAAGWVLAVGFFVGYFVGAAVHQLHHWLSIDTCEDRDAGNDDEPRGPVRPREA